MSDHAFAVVNPEAGGGRTRRAWPGLLARAADAGLRLEWATTSGPGDGTNLARRAVTEGHDLVVAVGGDGTVNEVVNGLIGDDGTARASLGVIATGRGRDVCRNLGIARAPEAALRRLVDGRDATVDLGLARFAGGARLFSGAVGVGFDAEVARLARTRRGSGTLPYLSAVLEALVHRAAHPVTMTGDATWSGPATAVVVANGACYGGGMRIAPAAIPTDGELDVVVLGDIGRLELLWWLPSVYRGTHLRNDKVRTARAERVRITSATPLPVHVDGEPVGTTPVDVSVRPGTLRVRR